MRGAMSLLRATISGSRRVFAPQWLRRIRPVAGGCGIAVADLPHAGSSASICPDVRIDISGCHASNFHSSTSSRSALPEPSSDDPTEARSPPSDRVVRMVDEIAQLTLLEVADMTHLLKKKLGIPDMAMGMPMAGMQMQSGQVGGAGDGAAAEAVVEKTSFDVKLERFEATAKLKIIKELRTFTDLGLKEAKEMVEKAPVIVKKGVSKEEATAISEKITALGGECSIE